MTPPTRHPLWNGGKLLHLAGATGVNIATQLLTIWAATHGWSSEQERAAVTLIGVLTGLSAQVYGIAAAFMMSWEDYLTTIASLPPAPARIEPGDNPRPVGGA